MINAGYVLFVTIYWLQNKGGYAYSFMIRYSNTSIICELGGFVRKGEKWNIRCVADDQIALEAGRAWAIRGNNTSMFLYPFDRS